MPHTAERIGLELPDLPYDFGALEPHIDAQTMQIHHDKHHAAYVNNLKTALEKYPDLQGRNVIELVSDLNSVPEDIRTAVRNNGGGHVNHSMFWRIMGPNGGGQPTGPIADAINQAFGGFEQLKTQFNDAGVKRFGSGWAWVVLGNDGRLQVMSTPNQDNPMMQEYGGLHPIFGNDVWEHAYYLKYQNRRPDYLAAWWNVVNWQEVARRFETAKGA